MLLAPGLQSFVVPRIEISADPTQTDQFNDLEKRCRITPAARLSPVSRLDPSIANCIAPHFSSTRATQPSSVVKCSGAHQLGS